jgi:hypothetical protein
MLSGAPRSLDQPFERTCPQQAFRRDVSVFNIGSTHGAFGFLMALVNFDFGLTTFCESFNGPSVHCSIAAPPKKAHRAFIA